MENPGVRKPVPLAVGRVMLIVRILEAQHAALLLVAEGGQQDIDELNNTVRSLLSELVDGSKN